MTGEFAGLSVLTIAAHGDARERDTWPDVADTLSNYETFWRELIVLLTNRIAPVAAPEWIRLRPTIPADYERLAMHNYSMFYHAAIAKRAIEEDRTRFAAGIYPRPEQIFVAMKSAIEQAKKLQSVARGILKMLGIDCKRFPNHPEALYQTIGAYRNAFAHNPVLGRAVDHKRELLPPKDRLPKRETDPVLLWSETAQIPSSEMIDGVKLLDDSWQELGAFLQAQWAALTAAFVEARKHDKFIAALGLKGFLPINCAPAEASISGPTAASGTIIVARSDAH